MDHRVTKEFLVGRVRQEQMAVRDLGVTTAATAHRVYLEIVAHLEKTAALAPMAQSDSPELRARLE